MQPRCRGRADRASRPDEDLRAGAGGHGASAPDDFVASERRAPEAGGRRPMQLAVCIPASGNAGLKIPDSKYRAPTKYWAPTKYRTPRNTGLTGGPWPCGPPGYSVGGDRGERSVRGDRGERPSVSPSRSGRYGDPGGRGKEGPWSGPCLPLPGYPLPAASPYPPCRFLPSLPPPTLLPSGLLLHRLVLPGAIDTRPPAMAKPVTGIVRAPHSIPFRDMGPLAIEGREPVEAKRPLPPASAPGAAIRLPAPSLPFP